jgi:hypothetical protein
MDDRMAIAADRQRLGRSSLHPSVRPDRRMRRCRRRRLGQRRIALRSVPGRIPDRPWSPIAAYVKDLLPTTPEPAQSIDADALQASLVGGPTGCTRIAPGGQTNAPDPEIRGIDVRKLTRRLARPMARPTAHPRRTARRLTGLPSWSAWTARRPTGLPCWPAWMARRLPGWPSWPACCNQLQRHRARPQEPGRAGFA